MAALHPVTATARNASAPSVIHRSSWTEEEKMVVFLPSYSAASLGLALVRKQAEKAFVIFFPGISVCWFPTVSTFLFLFCLQTILKLVFLILLCCFWALKANSLWGGVFFSFSPQSHDSAPCWRLLSVVQSCFLAWQSSAMETRFKSKASSGMSAEGSSSVSCSDGDQCCFYQP